MRPRLRFWLALVPALCVAANSLSSSPAKRIVSLNPSLTQILIALGATSSIVGVDAFSARQNPEVAELPTVGGLYNPSLEALVALSPDLVVLVPSAEQRDFRSRLSELEIPVASFDPKRFEEVTSSIQRLGEMVGASEAARERLAAIARAKQRVAGATRDRRHPSVVLVLQREPLFVVGGGNFIDEMLSLAGAKNLGARFSEGYPRVSIEWLVASAPDVILDSSGDPEPATSFWSRWPSLPAVANEKVVSLPVGVATLPGPYLDRALELLARSLHGDVLAKTE